MRRKRLKKTENRFLWMCLRILIGKHQRVCITKLLKSLYPTAQSWAVGISQIPVDSRSRADTSPSLKQRATSAWDSFSKIPHTQWSDASFHTSCTSCHSVLGLWPLVSWKQSLCVPRRPCTCAMPSGLARPLTFEPLGRSFLALPWLTPPSLSKNFRD